MTPHEWYTLAILAVAIVLFVTEWLRVDVVAIGVVLALMLTEVLTAQEAVAGFANEAVLSIAALFVLGGAILQTGLAAIIGERILAIAGRSETRLMIFVLLASALLSSFMSNTGTVAVLLPAIIALARNAKVSASRLLIPLAYGSILGGSATLIGTPPNIIVSDMLRKEGLQYFTFFDYAPIGLIILVVETGFMLLAARYLLPDHKPARRDDGLPTPEDLVSIYHLPENIFRLTIPSQSRLQGRVLADARLRQDYDLLVLQVLRTMKSSQLLNRASQTINFQSPRQQMLYPTAQMMLVAGDVLLVQGKKEDAQRAASAYTLELQAATDADKPLIVNHESGIAEVIIRPRADLVGRTVRESRFRSAFNLTILEMRRPGTDEVVSNNIDLPLKAGDILLVQGEWRHIRLLKENHRHDFVVMGQAEAEDTIGAPYRHKAPLALLILVAMIVLMVLDVLPLVTVSFGAAIAVVLAGCLTMDDAYDAIDWKSLVLIAGMLPMATALDKVGLVADTVELLMNIAGDSSPLIMLAMLFVFTAVFTQVLSNTATAVLVAPVGLAAAHEMGVAPQAFMMGVALAASMAFATPVASPTNTLVMGAGNYRFADFMRIGIPMVAIALVMTLIFVPIFFPF